MLLAAYACQGFLAVALCDYPLKKTLFLRDCLSTQGFFFHRFRDCRLIWHPKFALVQEEFVVKHRIYLPSEL